MTIHIIIVIIDTEIIKLDDTKLRVRFPDMTIEHFTRYLVAVSTTVLYIHVVMISKIFPSTSI